MPLSEDSGVDTTEIAIVKEIKQNDPAMTSTTPFVTLPIEEWIAALNVSTKYSVVSLSAILLHQLYGDAPYDCKYTRDLLADICTNIGAAPQSLKCATSLLDSEVPARPFVDLILEQEVTVEHGLANYVNFFVHVAISKGEYDSRTRVFIRKMCSSLRFPWKYAELIEDAAIDHFQQTPHELSSEEIKIQKANSKSKKRKQYFMIGLATIGGGAILGLTGGLAAPLLAAGAGAVIGTAGATALGSTAGVAIIGSLFGAAGAGLGGFKMKKRVGDVEEFEFQPLTEGSQLHMTIAIAGWLTDQNKDFKQIWLGLANSREQYVLKYESKYLMELGNSLDYLLSFALTTATQEVLKYTILSSLLVAVTWPVAAISAAAVIDNPWSVCIQRTEAAGKMLADVLISRQQGKRPVTLIGFSLGARVIFKCLMELASRPNCQGIIEDVIILGAPVSGDPDKWSQLPKVVAGRIVNGYCSGDWLLGYVYRATNTAVSIAGLHEIEYKDRRIQNIDLSEIVSGHLDYMKKMDTILKHVGINTKEYSIDAGNKSLQAWVQIQAKRQESPNHNSQGGSSNGADLPQIEVGEEVLPDILADDDAKVTSDNVEVVGEMTSSMYKTAGDL